MAGQNYWVHVSADGCFSFTAGSGESVTIGSEPVLVDGSLNAYLETVPFVKPAAKAKTEASGAKEVD